MAAPPAAVVPPAAAAPTVNWLVNPFYGDINPGEVDGAKLYNRAIEAPTEKLTIAQGICAPLLRKIRADLQRNIDPDSNDSNNYEGNEAGENEGDQEYNTVNRLDPRYSTGVSSPGEFLY